MLARVIAMSQLLLLLGYVPIILFFRFRDFHLNGYRWATLLPIVVYLGFVGVVLTDVLRFYSPASVSLAEVLWGFSRMAVRVVFMVAFAVYDIRIHTLMDECAAAKKARKEA